MGWGGRIVSGQACAYKLSGLHASVRVQDLTHHKKKRCESVSE